VPAAPVAVVDGRAQLQVVIDGVEWEVVGSLLDSGSRDPHVTTEPGEDGALTVLFGQGGRALAGQDAFGRRPPDGAVVDLRYRVGLGADGNVAAGTLTVPVDQGTETGTADWFLSVGQPVPATGGRDPEPLEHARRAGPAAARRRDVAVTAEDYRAAVADFDRSRGGGIVSRAGVDFRWTGSWLSVDLILDLAAGAVLDDRLAEDLLAFLDRRRLAGYDLQLLSAEDLPVQLAMTICVRPGFLAWAVSQEVARALGPGVREDGTRGVFHPDNLSFGEPVEIGRIYLAAASVPGVESVTVDVLAPLHSADPAAETAAARAAGRLVVGRDQIARLDDDPANPERGRLTLVTAGGR
jgi:predicted phage baseplate assembly protein